MRIRSGYSFRTAVGHLPDVVNRVSETMHGVATLTDRGSTFGFRRFREACKKKNIKPCYGVEIGVVDNLGEKKPIINYFTFLAKNEVRDVNLLVRNSSRANGKENVLLFDDAIKAENVVIIVGERVSFSQLEKIVGRPDTFLALSPSTPKVTVNAALKQSIPLIATSDNYYPVKEDLEFYRVALGKRANTQTYPMHILSDEEWLEAVKDVVSLEEAQKAIQNRNDALLTLNAQLMNAEMYKPVRAKTLYEMCVEGAARIGVDLNDHVYAERLNRELKLIKEKDFEDYFYIIANIVNWAKDRMIVGPARGSSCGSLVCYLLNITTVDPIQYGLIFERFIDINRKDMPDIDIDFSDARRNLVFDYMQEQYGSDYVARLGTVGMFKQRTALKQVGTLLKIPISPIEKVITATGDRLSLADTFATTDAGKSLIEAYPSAKLAEKIENHPNVASQHAAGMLVTKEPIINYVAVDEKSGAAMLDKKDAEVLNLLKIDALGLTQLSVFERTLKLIGKPAKNGWLETLPLDDQKAFDVLNQQRYAGIFQFMGRALQGLSSQINIDNLEDIVSIAALARPGPMASGGANTWVRRRAGLEEVSTVHPMMTELTKETYGVIVYQEQVMQIVRQIGLMSWEDTSDIRRAIGKSMGKDALEPYFNKFKEGAAKNNVEEHIARQIWDAIITFGQYGFNRSHAVAYGIVSYYCCFLKAYHPVEFCAATLDAETDTMKQIKLLRELKAEGIDYIPLDIDHSTDKWEVVEKEGKKILVGPLTTIRGLGPRFVSEIIGSRISGEPLKPSIKKKMQNAKTEIDSLYPIEDAFKSKYPTLEAAGISTEPTKIENIQCGIEGSVVIIAVLRKITIKDDNDEAMIARRGFELKGVNTKTLSMFFADDTDEIFCKIDRFLYEKLGSGIVDRGKVGKAMYAIKGTVPPRFRMISVENIKFLGMLDE